MEIESFSTELKSPLNTIVLSLFNEVIPTVFLKT